MGLINFSAIQDGTNADAADVNTPLQTIYDEFNGNISSVNLADGAITTGKLDDGAVTTAKIADGDVTLAKMAANSVDSDQYVDGSIDTVHISDGAVTPAKLQSGTGTTWVWQSWVPTITASGSMTVSALSIVSARYYLVGKGCYFELDFNCTLGGTTSNSIFFTLPVNAVSAAFNSIGTASQTADTVMGWVQLNNSATQAIIRRYDGINIATGSSKSVRVSGFYETA